MHTSREQSRTASGKGQQGLPTVTTAGHMARYAAAAPGGVSYSPTAASATTHSPNLLAGSRRSRDGSKFRGEWIVTRAQQYAASATRDDDYVQYHGPISAHPTDAAYIRRAEEAARTRNTNEETALNSLVGLGLTGTTDVVAERTTERASYRPLPSSNISPSMSAPVPDERQRAVMQSGLPSAYTHGGSAPSDWIYAPRSGAITDGLPASMRFDGEWQRESPSAAQLGAFRREPFPGSPGFAQVQQRRRQQAQQQQNRQSVGQSVRGTAPPPTSLNYSSGNSWGRRGSASSTSPTTATSGQQQTTSENARSLHRKDSSLTSSEGHASSMSTHHGGAHYSAATSLSSLRDPQSRKNSHASFDALRTSGSALPAMRSAGSRGALPPSPASATLDGQFARSQAMGPRSSSSDSAVQPAAAQSSAMQTRSFSSDVAKGKQQEATYEITSSNGHSTAGTSSHSRSNSISAQRIPTVRYDHVDEAPSSSSAVLVEDTRAAHKDALLAGLPPVNLRRLRTRLSPIPGSTYDTTTSARASRDPTEAKAMSQQAQEYRRQEAAAAALAPDEQVTTTIAEAEDAHRRFVLLQQLHLEELSAHAVENSGWLDSKNGCERVLMPRPSLHDMTGAEPPAAYVRQRARSSVAFERNRHQPTHQSMDADSGEARRRAQALLSRSSDTQAPIVSDGDRRLFHHRMPPATPTRSERALPQERPQVPKRTSSRQGRHRSRARSNANTPLTPALTPHALSSDDDDDEHGVQTPDVHTVLAQGRALDQERAQWRAEHQRSFGASTGRAAAHRHGGMSDVDGDDAMMRQRSLRNARSSPNLRHKARADGEAAHPPLPMADSSVTRSCFPSLFAHEADDEQTRHRRRAQRMRSRSLEGLSRLRASATSVASHALPCINSPSERHSHSAKGVESYDEKREWRLAGSSERRRRRRATTMSRHESGGSSRNTPDSARRQRLGSQPFVIGRMMFDEGTSPGLGEGPYEVRASSWTVTHVGQDVVIPPPVAHFGAAISSPRPDIGTAAVTPDRGQVSAGRHVTQRGYHRPRSSDELAAFLRASKKRQEDKKAVASPNTPRTEDTTETSMVEQGAREVVSLPVPARRRKSSHGSGGGSALAAAQVSSGEKEERLADTDSRAATDMTLPGLPLYFYESYAHPGAFQTPPLTQPAREGGGWFDGAAADAAPTAEIAPLQRPLAPQNTLSKPPSSGAAAALSVEQELQSIRSTGSNTVVRTSEDSASLHSRELWNTDDHADESFNSLFFRPPMPVTTRDTASLSTRSDVARGLVASTGSRTPSKRGGTSEDDRQLLTASFDEAAAGESPNEDDGRREEWITDVHDEELQELMGNLLVFSHLKTANEMAGGDERAEHNASGVASTTSRPSMQDEAAWNESSLGGNHQQTPRVPSVSTMPTLDRHVRSGSDHSSRKVSLERGGSLRIGRVDERQPRIEAVPTQPMETTTTSHDDTPKAQLFSRPRIDSMTASVLLDGGNGVHDDGGEDASAMLDFIEFASPATSARLSLPPQHADEQPSRGSAFLELPSSKRGGRTPPTLQRDSVASNEDSTSSRGTTSSPGDAGNDSRRRGSDGLLNMMRSRVWPTPPASPGPNQLGRGV